MNNMRLNFAKGIVGGVKIRRNYDPDQPREPLGSPEGGQWVKEGEEFGNTPRNTNEKLLSKWVAAKPLSDKEVALLMRGAVKTTSERTLYRGASRQKGLNDLENRVFATSTSEQFSRTFLGYKIDDNFKLIGKEGELLHLYIQPGIYLLDIEGSVQGEVLVQSGTKIVETQRRVVNGITVIDAYVYPR
jgi:hypothetical protein